MRFAWNTSAARVTLAPHVRKASELRLRRSLREAELLADVTKVREGAMGLDFAQRIATTLHHVHRDHKQNQKNHHEATVAGMTKEALAEALGTPAARVATSLAWALDDMAAAAAKLGVPSENLPDPRKAPSFFGAAAVHVERIARVLMEGRSRVHPGPADTALLADALACGRAVLVTGDEPLLEVAERVRPLFPRFSFVHREAWFAAL